MKITNVYSVFHLVSSVNIAVHEHLMTLQVAPVVRMIG